MPELPEVETMRRGVAPIAGSTIAEVWAPRSRLRPIKIIPRLATLRRRMTGRRIASVGRAGKRVVLHLDSDERLVIEPRMTGRLLLDQPPDGNYVRLVLELQGGPHYRLMFRDVRGLGVVRLLSPRQCARELGPAHLGPDALEITAAELAARLSASRRAVKVALMDQRAVAGIGNLYASEILHVARLHPALPCNLLRPRQWLRLHECIGEVLREAIDCQGSTLDDRTYATVENRAGAYQERHRVYQRQGQPCSQCGRAKIVRIVQAQRSTFFCPRCQADRGRS